MPDELASNFNLEEIDVGFNALTAMPPSWISGSAFAMSPSTQSLIGYIGMDSNAITVGLLVLDLLLVAMRSSGWKVACIGMCAANMCRRLPMAVTHAYMNALSAQPLYFHGQFVLTTGATLLCGGFFEKSFCVRNDFMSVEEHTCPECCHGHWRNTATRHLPCVV